MSDTRIIVPLPAELSAGIQGVQVIHRSLMSSPPEPHSGVESNLMTFLFRPKIIGEPKKSDIKAEANNRFSGKVELTVTPAIGAGQRVVLLLNELNPASPPGSAYSFKLPPPPLGSPPQAPTEKILIPFYGVKAGTYVVRVQVDGAESPLLQDATGRYFSPQISIS